LFKVWQVAWRFVYLKVDIWINDALAIVKEGLSVGFFFGHERDDDDDDERKGVYYFVDFIYINA
jgi:hypothetical protein